jgi:hypothetical protein
VAVLLFSGSGGFAGEYRVIPEQSIFAVVTHKGGLAGRLAHDHFIATSNYEADLEFSESNPSATRFSIRFPAEELIVDDKALGEKWYPRLEALAVLDDPFREISAEDREKVRETMLGGKQLDAAKFPEISAEIALIEEGAKELGTVPFSHRVTLALSVHGRTVEQPVWARYELVDDILKVEAVGAFRFRDFGIKPYSAMLGTVKVKDTFHLYVAMDAVPVDN